MKITAKGCYIKPDGTIWRDCPKCKESKSVNEGFGWRNPEKGEEVRNQSYCNICRTESSKISKRKNAKQSVST